LGARPPTRALLVGLALCGGPAWATTHVAVPEVSWETLVPYVRANIVPERSGDSYDVFVCSAHTDRAAVQPFDEALSDFTMVLITQAMRDDHRVADAIENAAEAFRLEMKRASERDRAEYRAAFWRFASGAEDLLPRLRAKFETARTKGVLRCWVCDKESTFAPTAQRAGRGKP